MAATTLRPVATVLSPAPELPPLDDARLHRLAAYADQYHDVFTRADQSRWFHLYLRGLLGGGDRNVEAIAARVRTDDGTTNFAQALQHFVSHSPWDAGRLVARYRELLPARHRRSPGVWVVHDGVIPKKGRHSVGTQRQFARSLGRKVNCQVAVVVGRTGPAGYVPLSMRLYLPGYWLRESDAVEKTVPAEFRGHASKAVIASGLLDELTRDGWPAGEVAVDDSYLNGDVFREPHTSAGPLLATANTHFEWLKHALGLDHYEGRAWTGWHHHAALVLAAYGFLTSDAGEVQ